MRLKRFFTLAAIGALAMAVSYLLMQDHAMGLGQKRLSEGSKAAGAAIQGGALFQLRGFDYTSYEEDKKVFRLKIDRLEMLKRKFMFFNLEPLRDVLAFGVEIHLYRHPEEKVIRDGTTSMPWDAVLQALPEIIGNKRVISSFRIEDLRVSFYKNGQVVSSMTAEKTTISPKHRSATFKGKFSVTAREKTLISQEGMWDPASKLFSVPGPYVLVNAGEIMRGEGLRFDPGLKVF